MSDFDIKSLYGFRPARLHCQKCLGLFPDARALIKGDRAVCPVCGVEYVPTEGFRVSSVGRYLAQVGLAVDYGQDLLEHCMRLADAAHLLVENPFRQPPVSALYAALSRARHFVHFATFGISHVFIGALKLIAQRIRVRGIVSSPRDDTANELTEFSNEAPSDFFQVKVCAPSGPRSVPHQKLIIIDGLLAFEGSANMTLQAWRNAGQDLEIVKAVTKVDEVIALHNRYFSAVWAKLSDQGKRIEMIDVPF